MAQLDNSQVAIRDTTKWLVAAAAGVGAVVVAGLQLSNLPAGFLATTMALVGFTVALLGVAAVIFAAAGVLSVGFTTLGQLAELYDTEVPRIEFEEKWDERIARAQDRVIADSHRRTVVAFLSSALARVQSRSLRILRRIRTRYAEWEGVRIPDLLEYLEKDTIVFSNGLAADIPQLYDRLRATDDEILNLRGETPASDVAAGGYAEPTASETVSGSSTSKGSASANASSRQLNEALWRLTKLETAAGTLIAFANQRIIERKFHVLKWSVRLGGIAVAIGVGLFALAPKVAKPKALAVDKPTAVTIVVKRRSDFGAECTAATLSGVAVGGTWKKPIVVTAGNAVCPARSLTLDPATGFAVPKTSNP